MNKIYTLSNKLYEFNIENINIDIQENNNMDMFERIVIDINNNYIGYDNDINE